MNQSAESPTRTDRTGRPAAEVPDVSAHVIQFVGKVPYTVVMAQCPKCSANHRHVVTGVRVAPCGAVYNLVVAGGAR